jgi:hypothetical protein
VGAVDHFEVDLLRLLALDRDDPVGVEVLGRGVAREESLGIGFVRITLGPPSATSLVRPFSSRHSP